jgi:hypothetical protein
VEAEAVTWHKLILYPIAAPLFLVGYTLSILSYPKQSINAKVAPAFSSQLTIYTDTNALMTATMETHLKEAKRTASNGTMKLKGDNMLRNESIV